MANKDYSNSQNIYVESDFQNIYVVDPNKVVDSQGQVKERLVNHEDMVMYAELTAKILPRTKLAVGEGLEEPIYTNLRVGQLNQDRNLKTNFTFPNAGNYTTDWSDQITGKGSLEGKGLNQIQQYTNTETLSDGKTQKFTDQRIINKTDSQFLGITNINIKINSSYTPVVDIDFVDVQGRALFEQGEDSPYSAFMQMPYPLFELTLKGYFGKALRYELMLQTFNARFDANTGNYIISTKFIARTHALLNDINLNQLFTVSKMYPTTIQTNSNSSSNSESQSVAQTGNDNTTTRINVVDTTRGYQKLQQVYQVYRDKGLIGNDFPVTSQISMGEMVNRLERFDKFVMDTYSKQDFSVLIDANQYKKNLDEYRNAVYGLSTTVENFFTKFIDPKSYVVPSSAEGIGKSILYQLKKNDNNLQFYKDAITDLKSKIENYNRLLKENPSFGENGRYKIDNKVYTDSNLSFDIKLDDFLVNITNPTDQVNFSETARLRLGAGLTDNEVELFKGEFIRELFLDGYRINAKTFEVEKGNSNSFFKFGNIVGVTGQNGNSTESNSFLNKLNKLEKDYDTKVQEIQKKLTDALSKKIVDPNIGLGFKPTIRNVFAVVCANADTFLQLMDDTHEDAWNQRSNTNRINSVLSENKKALSSESKNITDTNKVIYPWPQYFVLEEDEDGNSQFELKYPGITGIASDNTNPITWPEVEFVEQYLTAAVQKETPTAFINFENDLQQTKLSPIIATEFPFNRLPYQNTIITNYLFEIFERSYVLSNYSKIITDDLEKQSNEIFTQIEFNNILNSVENNPELLKILKESKFNLTNLLSFLKSTSQNGQGTNWNLFKRNEYVTDRIKVMLENPNRVYSIETLNNGKSTNSSSDGDAIAKLRNLLANSLTNTSSFLDTYPFGDLQWIQENMANGSVFQDAKQSNDTTKVLTVYEPKKTIASFDNVDANYEKKLLTNFGWLNNRSGGPNQSTSDDQSPQPSDNINTTEQLKTYYETRTENNLYLTESYIDYSSLYPTTNRLTSKQTTSILNTPYFINAIIDGVAKEKNNNVNPYVALGYLFLNSLPLSTLKEKFTNYITQNENSGQGSVEYLNYISSVFNKYSAIHKIPYLWILKYGSIWHRYKQYYTSNTDILSNVWGDFDYQNGYDPVAGNLQKQYVFNDLNGNSLNYSHNQTINNTQYINRGFYPQVLNDFYYYFTSNDLFNSYSSSDVGTGILNKNIKIGEIENQSTDDQNVISNYFVYGEILGNSDFASSDQDNVLVFPSVGHLRSDQVENELNNDFSNNYPSIFNGGVRSLWNVSNFGYFDNNIIGQPTPDEYLKIVKNDQQVQEPFSLTNTTNQYGYANIEEIFSVFNKDLLDEFEKLFLNFCQKSDKFSAPSFFNEVEVKSNFFEQNRNIATFSLFDMMKSTFIVQKPDNLSNDPTTIAKQIAVEQINSMSNKLSEDLLKKDVVLKLGNPSNYNRKYFNDFVTNNSDLISPEIIQTQYSGYINNSLPPQTTLINSQNQYPDAWDELYLRVGNFEDGDLFYKDSGSYITDFFINFNIDFTAANVRNFEKIIKIYITQRKLNSNLTSDDFRDLFNNYVGNKTNLQRSLLNNILTKSNTLPSVIIEESENIQKSSVDSDEIKTEIYYNLKLLNDKWVAGQDFKRRTLFEDFLFLDRANRDIGDKVVININDLRNYLKVKRDSTSLYSLVGSLIENTNMTYMPLPTYTNFYGLPGRVSGSEPNRIENLANDLFGTHMEVETVDTRPKILLIYVGKPSEYLDQPDNPNYVFANDAFDLSVPNGNGVVSENTGDPAASNRCVGFTVDFGVPNQGVFKDLDIDMNTHKNAAPVYDVLARMGSEAGGKKVSQQSQSLYQYYQSLTYTASIRTIGNAQIQPTMYFNLRYVPMFRGPYYILNVNHTIGPGSFETQFDGIRVPKFVLKNIDKQAASVNLDLVKRYQERLRNLDIKSNTRGTNENSVDENTAIQAQEIAAPEDAWFTDPDQGVEKVNTVLTTVPISGITSSIGGYSLITRIFLLGTAKLMKCSREDCNELSNVYNNNIYNIKPYEGNYQKPGGNLSSYISEYTNYSVNGSNDFYVSFDDFTDSIRYMNSKFSTYLNLIRDNNPNIQNAEDDVSEDLAQLWYQVWVEGNPYNQSITTTNNQITRAKRYFKNTIRELI